MLTNDASSCQNKHAYQTLPLCKSGSEYEVETHGTIARIHNAKVHGGMKLVDCKSEKIGKARTQLRRKSLILKSV
jgi:hypothetical protein